MEIPIIKNFRSTTYIKAFLLSSLAASLVAVGAIETREILEKDEKMKKKSELIKALITFIVSFFIAMTVYFAMYIFFEYGGAMLIDD